MPKQQLPELVLGDGDLFGAVLVGPAFSSDLSTWTVTIHKCGMLTQTVSISQPPNYDRHIAVLRQHVPEESLESLKRIVDEENLQSFGQFPGLCITDQQDTVLMIRLFGETTVINAYGPHAVAMLSESEADKAKAKRYCRLWDAILKLTPFTPYRDR